MNTSFPSTLTEWNILYLSMRNSASLNTFKDRLLQFVKPLKNSVYTCPNPIGIKYLSRLRLRFFVTINLSMAFQRLLIRLVAAGQQLKIPIGFFTIPTIQLHEIPFQMKLQLLADPLLIKTKSKFPLFPKFQTFLYGNAIYSINDNKLILDTSTKIRRINFLIKTVMVNASLSQFKLLSSLLLLSL